MISHPDAGDAPTTAPRTWRSWRSAWAEAAYGPAGFWSREQPGDHFATAVGMGSLVARATAGLLPVDGRTVVDVGAGDGQLLAALLDLVPNVTLLGVDRRPRPPALDPRIGWVADHWDVDSEQWAAGGPEAWCGEAPLLVAHEWLDDLPVPVVEHDAAGTPSWREVEVDQAGNERPGASPGPADLAWLARWWPTGRRAEVGRSRDAAWAALVRTAVGLGGRALAVDYGHGAESRPVDGTLAAYGGGRRREPVPDGTVNLTAAVAVDALAAAGESVGATTLLLDRQADVLGRVPSEKSPDPIETLVRRSERAALTAPHRWGDLWWLLQGPRPTPA